MKLVELPWGARLGLACIVITLLGGLAASAAYVRIHHAPKDDEPGLSVDDVKGAYHGVQRRAPLLAALERRHPAELTEANRQTLLTWLRGDRISQDYDDLDLGDAAPAEIIRANCLSCHSRGSSDEVAKRTPLEFWDDVKRLAYSKQLDPVPVSILVTSTHAHALGLGPLTVVTIALLLATRWPRRLVSLMALVMGAALMLDLGGWWAAREVSGAVFLVIGAGAVYLVTTSLALLAVLADLLLPGGRRSRPSPTPEP